MEALTISAANLDTIEKNLGYVAQELSGVISNVNNVNSDIQKVEDKVSALDSEVKSLIEEIRQTTIVTNARQSIMYNESQINQKYGHLNQVRRTTVSLLNALDSSEINKDAIINLKNQLLINTPNYWLANALGAICYWLLNDVENTKKEVENALKKNKTKTSLFFCLINASLKREDASIKWLNKYLSYQNPLKLDKDFITVLDLTTSKYFNNTGKQIIRNKIESWITSTENKNDITNKQINTWQTYINSLEISNLFLPVLCSYSKDYPKIEDNLKLSSSYGIIYNNIIEDINKENTNKNIEDIIENLIYDYEDEEQKYQKDNFYNKLIIECHGSREEADKIFNKEKDIYDKEIDIISLINNIAIYPKEYKISSETQKFALSIAKKYLIMAYDKLEKENIDDNYSIKINDFETTTSDGKNHKQINEEIELFISNIHNKDEYSLLIALIIINILGITGIFITTNSQILCTIIGIILITTDAFLLLRLNKKTKAQNIVKNQVREYINIRIEKYLAEIVEYQNTLKERQLDKNNLYNFLNNLKENNLSNNQERNIRIGE